MSLKEIKEKINPKLNINEEKGGKGKKNRSQTTGRTRRYLGDKPLESRQFYKLLMQDIKTYLICLLVQSNRLHIAHFAPSANVGQIPT